MERDRRRDGLIEPVGEEPGANVLVAKVGDDLTVLVAFIDQQMPDVVQERGDHRRLTAPRLDRTSGALACVFDLGDDLAVGVITALLVEPDQRVGDLVGGLELPPDGGARHQMTCFLTHVERSSMA